LDKTPMNGQRMLFSATLDNGVDKIVKRFLHNPVLHSVDEANSPVAAMTHHVFEVATPEAKTELVRTLASGTGRRILFMRTKHHAKKLAKQLTEAGIPSVDLHGNLSQPQRDRNLAAFSDGTARVLVATDVAARGVHVDNVELVVHVDPPMEHKAYLHRSGRTARAGSEGDVVTVIIPGQKRDLQQLMRKADINVTIQTVTPNSPAVSALVGEVAAYDKPLPVDAARTQQGGGGRSQGANAQRKRALRDGGDVAGGRGAGAGGGEGRARRDRSGRPAGSSSSDSSRGGSTGGGRRDGAGNGGRDGARDGASRSSQGERSGAARSSSAQGGRGRSAQGERSASGSQGGRSGGLQVGSLVRGSAQGRGPRRAQG
jgi:superfamily II DNA/RNA helicase